MVQAGILSFANVRSHVLSTRFRANPQSTQKGLSRVQDIRLTKRSRFCSNTDLEQGLPERGGPFINSDQDFASQEMLKRCFVCGTVFSLSRKKSGGDSLFLWGSVAQQCMSACLFFFWGGGRKPDLSSCRLPAATSHSPDAHVRGNVHARIATTLLCHPCTHLCRGKLAQKTKQQQQMRLLK